MKQLTHYDVVEKLIGDVSPKGDSSRDYEILENLKELCDLHSKIHTAIDDVAFDFKDDQRHSIKMCCDYAKKYIDSLGISE